MANERPLTSHAKCEPFGIISPFHPISYGLNINYPLTISVWPKNTIIFCVCVCILKRRIFGKKTKNILTSIYKPACVSLLATSAWNHEPERIVEFFDKHGQKTFWSESNIISLSWQKLCILFSR